MDRAFVYLSADVDVGMLRFMEINETSAYFVDPLIDDWNVGQGFDVVKGYIRNHKADIRMWYKQTTVSLRPWKDDEEHKKNLTSLLMGRMRANSWIRRPVIKSFAPIEIGFLMKGIPRTLTYLTENGYSLDTFRNFNIQVSTIVTYGGSSAIDELLPLFPVNESFRGLFSMQQITDFPPKIHWVYKSALLKFSPSDSLGGNSLQSFSGRVMD